MRPFSLDQALPQGVALLEASAGTGKTYSIAGLALRLIAEAGIPVSELLIVTFTRAATAELASRIHQRLLGGARELRSIVAVMQLEGHAGPDTLAPGASLSADPVLRALTQGQGHAELQLRLRRVESAIASFDEAAISTIHGFCQRALQGGAFESATDFDVEMEADLRPLVHECVDDFMASSLVDTPPAFYAILRDVAKLDRAALLKLAATLENNPRIGLVPSQSEDPIVLHERALGCVQALWPENIDALLANIAELRGTKDKARKWDLKTYTDKPLRSARDQGQVWLDAHAGQGLLPHGGPSALRMLSRTQIVDKLKAGSIDDLDAGPLALTCALDDLLYAPSLAFKLRFAQDFLDRFAQAKQERGILAFDDQLSRLADALADPILGPPLHALITSQYRAALIDESQDTDALQWSIFSTLFGTQTRPLYLIGDPKQAIYSFRGADIATYLAAREVAGEQRFGLQVNWRSDAPLVQSLNALYAKAPQLSEGIEVPAVAAAPGHEHNALIDPQSAASVQLRHFPHDIAGASNRGANEFSGAFKAGESLATFAAAEAAAMLMRGVQVCTTQDEAARVLNPGDIAVIVNSHFEAAAVEQQMHQRGVPCVRAGNRSVFDSDAATALDAWIEAVLAQRRSGAVRAVLIGPLIGLRTLELDSMSDLAWERWSERFASWQQRWLESGFLAAWEAFCAERQLATHVLEQDQGARLWTDLQQLARLLHEAECAGALSPSALARWYRSWPEPGRELDDAHKVSLERDDDAVTITTLHASKGLEYGVVIYPGAWRSPRQFKDSDVRVRVQQHDPPWILDMRDERISEDKARHKRLAQRADLEEEARKLYVALTRAKHRLVLYWGAFEGAAEGPFARLLFPEFDATQVRALNDEQRLEALRQNLAPLAPGIELLAHDDLDVSQHFVPRATVGPDDLHARSFRRASLDRDWRRSSYSSMSRSAHFVSLEQLDDANPHALGVDHDAFVRRPEADEELVADERDAAVGTDPPHSLATDPEGDHLNAHTNASMRVQVPLATFARGAAAGTFLHEVLEHLRFDALADRPYLLQLCEQMLQKHGLEPGQGPLIARALVGALQTPLGAELGTWSLAQLAAGDRIDEMQFDLPIAGGYQSRGTFEAATTTGASPPTQVSGEAIAELFSRFREPSSTFPQSAIDHYAGMRFDRPLRGFLTGAIDLFFRAQTRSGETRYFVADYKSNWLGDRQRSEIDNSLQLISTTQHYRQAALSDAMVHHDYHLQYHLYVLAAHRYLRSRLGADYDYVQHFGGAYYLFLRGMTGPPLRGSDDDTQLAPGVFFDRPPFAFVDALDRLFARVDSVRATTEDRA